MTSSERLKLWKSDPSRHRCACGKPAARYTSSGWQCERCLRQPASAMNLRQLFNRIGKLRATD